MSEEKTPQNQSTAEAEGVQIPLADLIRTRREKVRQLAEKNINCYPYRYERTHHVKQILDHFETLEKEETAVSVAGRIMLKRKMGKVFFADLHDSTGRIQIYAVSYTHLTLPTN